LGSAQRSSSALEAFQALKFNKSGKHRSSLGLTLPRHNSKTKTAIRFSHRVFRYFNAPTVIDFFPFRRWRLRQDEIEVCSLSSRRLPPCSDNKTAYSFVVVRIEEILRSVAVIAAHSVANLYK